MSNVTYVLDANVFIEAYKRYYSFEIAPSFWTALVAHGQALVVLSIDRVKDEIDKGQDDLTAWVNNYWLQYFRTSRDES